MGFPKRTDLPYPIASYNQWFSKDLDRVAGFIGQTVETLRRWFTEANVCERAYAYSAIGKYHGFDNLDVYPLTFNSRAEVEARYSAVSSA
jgi:hypothetical protein